MFKWIGTLRRKLFSLKRKSRRSQPVTDPTARRTAIVCGPAYDEATRTIGEWLAAIPIPQGVEKHVAIGADVTRDTIEKILAETDGTNRVKVFGGHGSEEALLGPLYDRCVCATVDGRDFAVLYDHDSQWNGAGSLFAFCCKSALKLGPSFAGANGKTFLGFVGNIGYDLENQECQEVWKKIVQVTASEIIKDGVISEKHEQLLLDLYSEALDYFRNGAGQGNDRDLETVILLMRHKKFLRRIGGSP